MTKTGRVQYIYILLINIFVVGVSASKSIDDDYLETTIHNRVAAPFTFEVSGNGNDDIIFQSGFEAPFISFFTATPSVVNSGDSTTLSWTLNNNATSCVKSGDWVGSVSADNGMFSEVILDITSTSMYALECFNSFGGSQLASVQVIVNEANSPPVLIMSANPTTVDFGESSVISWTVANDAVTCIQSGDWMGSLEDEDVTNGTHSMTIENIISSSSFGLTCSNSFGSSPTQTVAVSITEGQTDCSTQPPILNGAEDRTIRLIPGAFGTQLGTPANPAAYNGFYEEIVNGGQGWPGSTGGQSFATLSKDQYIAMEFVTDDENKLGRLVMIPPGNAQGPGSSGITMSISECPGDFTTHLNQDRCRSIGGGSPTLRWSQDPNTSAVTHCLLDQNRRYYLNIVHSNSVATDFSDSSCGSEFCGIIFSNN